jgi:hypothetical protein
MLLATNGHSLLRHYLGIAQETASFSDRLSEAQSRRVLDWASRFSEGAWTNFLAELLLADSVEPDAGDDSLREERLASRADAAGHWLAPSLHNEPLALVAARRIRLRGLAQSRSGDHEAAAGNFADAIRAYERLGRPREVIETVTHWIDVARGSHTNGVHDPVSMANWFAGKSYQTYELGLAQYSSALDLRRVGKPGIALQVMREAAGFARRSGDSALYVRCLRALASMALETNQPAEASRYRKDIEAHLAEPWLNSESYQRAAGGYMRRLILGEVAIFIVIIAIITWAAFTIAGSTREAIGCVVGGGGMYAAGKAWNVLKVRRAVLIDRD